MSSEEWSEKNVAEKGFTLIELLIVIAILGILAVVGILAFGGIRQKAEDSTNLTELKEVQTAASAYVAVEDAMPANVTAMVTGDYLDSAPRCSYTMGTTPKGITQGTCP
ncbi:MAG: type II secretion system protein [Acidimicrobiia bacterium]|nr:type II secretion system protein [Acidimicrobiia bacterium]